MGSFLQAQECYWSSYNITVADHDIETVASRMNTYFSQEGSKKAGVSVYLFENHFFDHSVDYTHSIVFTGSLEDLGNQYAKESSADWKLFLTKLRTMQLHTALGKTTVLLPLGSLAHTPSKMLSFWTLKMPLRLLLILKNTMVNTILQTAGSRLGDSVQDAVLTENLIIS
mgnify:CR=1 FL=1|jgi:hypothetical protein